MRVRVVAEAWGPGEFLKGWREGRTALRTELGEGQQEGRGTGGGGPDTSSTPGM